MISSVMTSISGRISIKGSDGTRLSKSFVEISVLRTAELLNQKTGRKNQQTNAEKA